MTGKHYSLTGRTGPGDGQGRSSILRNVSIIFHLYIYCCEIVYIISKAYSTFLLLSIE